MKDRREYVRVAVDLPENPKLIDASVSAKWLYVAALCYAGQHLTDGHVPISAATSKAGVARRFVADLRDRGLIHDTSHDCSECPQPRTAGLVIHDYLAHQRSRQEAEDSRSGKRKGADLTNHKRWHKEPDPDCRYCLRSSDRSSDSVQRSPDRSLNGRSGVAEVEVEEEVGLGSQSPNGRSAPRTGDGLDLDRISNLIGSGTDQQWARRVVTQVLDRAPAGIRDQQRYVEAAIRERPADYRPTATPPRKDQLCDHGRERATCPWEESA